MKIVVLAPRFPFPLDKGDRLTVFHLLRYLSQRHEVSLVCFMEPDQDPAWVEKVEPFCERVETIALKSWRAYSNCLLGLMGSTPLQMNYYSDPSMTAAVEKLVAEWQPDLVYAHTIRMGQYSRPLDESLTKVLAMQISMTLNYRRLAEHASDPISRFVNNTEYKKVRDFEADFARQFDKVLLISEHDLAAIEQKEPLTNVFFSPHGVDFEYFSPDATVAKRPNSLIFTGNMNYAPNTDAIQYFYDEVFPLVQQEIPDVELRVVGANDNEAVKALGTDPAVTVTGRVPDLREYTNQAQIALAPIRIGAGLQNKVLEGMSMGLPMVVTSVANEGIKAIPNENILIGDTAQAFAAQVISLLQDEAKRKQIGAAAREFIVEKWSWEKHFGDLEEMFCELATEKFETEGSHKTFTPGPTETETAQTISAKHRSTTGEMKVLANNI